MFYKGAVLFFGAHKQGPLIYQDYPCPERTLPEEQDRVTFGEPATFNCLRLALA